MHKDCFITMEFVGFWHCLGKSKTGTLIGSLQYFQVMAFQFTMWVILKLKISKRPNADLICTYQRMQGFYT